MVDISSYYNSAKHDNYGNYAVKLTISNSEAQQSNLCYFLRNVPLVVRKDTLTNQIDDIASLPAPPPRSPPPPSASNDLTLPPLKENWFLLCSSRDTQSRQHYSESPQLHEANTLLHGQFSLRFFYSQCPPPPNPPTSPFSALPHRVSLWMCRNRAGMINATSIVRRAFALLNHFMLGCCAGNCFARTFQHRQRLNITAADRLKKKGGDWLLYC